MRLVVPALTSCLLIFPTVGIVRAEPEVAGATVPESPGSPPPGYARAVDRAVDEFARGNFAEARAAFLRAQALFPNARILRGLAKTEFELRNYRACIEYVQRALASEVRPLRGELRRDARELMRAAEAYVARYRIELSPSEAELTLDGERVPPGDDAAAREVLLQVGDHVLLASAPDHYPERRELHVVGDDRTVRLQLRPVLAPPSVDPTLVERPIDPVVADPGPLVDTDDREDGSLWSSPWLWTAVGVGVAAAVVVVVVAGADGGDGDGVGMPDGAEDSPWGILAASPAPGVRF